MRNSKAKLEIPNAPKTWRNESLNVEFLAQNIPKLRNGGIKVMVGMGEGKG